MGPQPCLISPVYWPTLSKAISLNPCLLPKQMLVLCFKPRFGSAHSIRKRTRVCLLHNNVKNDKCPPFIKLRPWCCQQFFLADSLYCQILQFGNQSECRIFSGNVYLILYIFFLTFLMLSELIFDTLKNATCTSTIWVTGIYRGSVCLVPLASFNFAY